MSAAWWERIVGVYRVATLQVWSPESIMSAGLLGTTPSAARLQTAIQGAVLQGADILSAMSAGLLGIIQEGYRTVIRRAAFRERLISGDW